MSPPASRLKNPPDVSRAKFHLPRRVQRRGTTTSTRLRTFAARAVVSTRM